MRQTIWFQHDAAHFSRNVRNHLDVRFGQQWIGRGGPVRWPARSPDLSCLDFFLWGHMNTLVYDTPVDNGEELVRRIAVAAGEIYPGTEICMEYSRKLGSSCAVDVRLALKSVDETLSNNFDPSYFCSCKFIITTNIHLRGIFLFLMFLSIPTRKESISDPVLLYDFDS
ncbi:hypothetical protein AVEN_208050-1 [Araneus ventricosus]|uniref:Uncharacterized protein n=1 Tax=Araneus ventricosus TaxID=182803 RepID=A0A4Y2F173_ARAVE|nr:hypothetical protein AVEN_208050-1 [Araneus ventricosus]